MTATTAYIDLVIENLFNSQAAKAWCEQDIASIQEEDPSYDGSWTYQWRICYWVAGELSRRFDRSFAWGLSQVFRNGEWR